MSAAEGKTINVPMTAEEHYSLVALLRTAVSSGTLDVLGLQGLQTRLTQPYRQELQERGSDVAGTTVALRLPGFYLTGNPVHLVPQSRESLFEGRDPLNWYEWPRRSA